NVRSNGKIKVIGLTKNNATDKYMMDERKYCKDVDNYIEWLADKKKGVECAIP
ncbi:12103_t:CDS:1, partial [Racocetra persica]